MFVFFYQAISTIVVALTLLCILVLILSKETWSTVLFVEIIVFFTGPSWFVALTLVAMLYLDSIDSPQDAKRDQVVYIPVENIQFMKNPGYKLL